MFRQADFHTDGLYNGHNNRWGTSASSAYNNLIVMAKANRVHEIPDWIEAQNPANSGSTVVAAWREAHPDA
jgi:hypothetical protein